ncbi:MAG: saccharopine dehydrogenase family protein [Calditrichaceae bacterium]
MKVIVLGAGKMARGLVFDFLNNRNITDIWIVDQSKDALDIIEKKYKDSRIRTTLAGADDYAILRPLFEQADGAVSAVPYDFNFGLSQLAVDTATHFVDLGGNNSVVEKQFGLHDKAKAKGIGIVPDCGLAPGMVSIVTAHAISELARIDSVKIRVGGLPVNPKPPLNYMLVFSVHGLINEYIEPAVIIEDGEIRTVPSMTDVEELEFPKPFGLLEAFYTSGGTSTLPQTYEGKIKRLDYKTIRYPGHAHIMKAMIDLGFTGTAELDLDGRKYKTRDIFEKLLGAALTHEDDDVVLIRVTAKGQKAGSNKIIQYQAIEYGDPSSGLSAMMRTTAFPAAIVLQMLLSGQIKDHGVLKQEISVPTMTFMEELEKRNIKFIFMD